MNMDEPIAPKPRRAARNGGAQEGMETAAPRTARPRSGGERKRLREAELLLEVARRLAGYDSLDDVLKALRVYLAKVPCAHLFTSAATLTLL